MTSVLTGAAVALLLLALVGPAPRRLPVSTGATARDLDLRALVERTIGRARPRYQQHRRDRQLPDALDRLGSSLRAGESIGPALVDLAGDLREPLGGELLTVARAVEHGVAVTDALAGWAASPSASADVRLVAAALTIGAGTGGEVARAVDGVAATLRERHEILAEARSLATQARASAGVLAAAPVAFAALVASVEPAVVRFLFTNPVGIGCLVLGVGLDALGVLWMERITRSAG